MKNNVATLSTPESRLTFDPSLRGQRGHRHSAIPSLFRLKASPQANHDRHDLTDTVKRMDTLKKQSYNLLSVANPNPPQPSGEPSFSRRRFASTPQALPSDLQTQIDIDKDRKARGAGVASPPLVDFTRFEDTYRGPRAGHFEGLMTTSTSRSRSGMRSVSSGVKPALKSDAPSTSRGGDAQLVVPPSELELSPDPAATRKPDPRLVLASLRDILGFSQVVEGYLDAHDLLAAHQLDQLDFEAREAAKTALEQHGRIGVQGQQDHLVVLGEPLRKAWIYSSTTQVLGGKEHELPALVVHCVEELYRTGIYQSNLFRTLPNRFRLLELINIFDSEEQLPGSVIRSRQRSIGQQKVHPRAGFGFNTSLHLESTPDICALLTTYLSSLPQPLLLPPLFRAIWDWCDIEHDEEDQARQRETFGQRLSPIPMARSYTNPTESAHILIAQLVMHLLPSPYFSLLVYLLAFFSQVALVREENGVGVQDLGRMFGARLFGSDAGSPPSSAKDKGKGKARDTEGDDVGNSKALPTRGEKMMCWFLRRWAPISDGLFEVVEDAKMGMFRPLVMRKDSLGKDVLSGWLVHSDDDDIDDDNDNCSADEDGGGGGQGDQQQQDDDDDDDDGRAGVQDVSFVAVPTSDSRFTRAEAHSKAASSWGGGNGTPIPRIRILASPPQDHSTPKTFKQRKRRSSLYADRTEMNDYVMVTPTPSPTTPVRPASVARKAIGEADETLDVTQLHARSLSSSTYPGSPQQPIDERLMDVSMPALLVEQTLPAAFTGTSEEIGSRSQDGGQIPARSYVNCAVQTEPQKQELSDGRPEQLHHKTAPAAQPPSSPSDDERHLRKALQIIAELENQLKDRTECLTDSLKDLARCKLELEASRRREQVKELEKRFSCGSRV